jgi:hypothetical protein
MDNRATSFWERLRQSVFGIAINRNSPNKFYPPLDYLLEMAAGLLVAELLKAP